MVVVAWLLVVLVKMVVMVVEGVVLVVLVMLMGSKRLAVTLFIGVA